MHAAISKGEEKVFAAAQSFVTLGLRGAGYEYVIIDVCFSPAAIGPLYLKHASGLLGSVRSRPQNK
jgi:hypothetical protein